jgi:hypothetical protein
MKEEFNINELLNKDIDKNLVYHSCSSSEGNILIYDLNSNPSNIPLFLKTAINEIILSKEENPDKRLNVILLKDILNSANNNLKNSVVLNISLSKIQEHDKITMKYVKREILIKSQKIFDLKKNFNPQT